MKYLQSNLFVLFFSLVPSLGYSQESQPEPERGSVLPGFIITLQGDTVKQLTTQLINHGIYRIS